MRAVSVLVLSFSSPLTTVSATSTVPEARSTWRQARPNISPVRMPVQNQNSTMLATWPGCRSAILAMIFSRSSALNGSGVGFWYLARLMLDTGLSLSTLSVTASSSASRKTLT